MLSLNQKYIVRRQLHTKQNLEECDATDDAMKNCSRDQNKKRSHRILTVSAA